MARCPSEEVLRQFASDTCEPLSAVEVEAHVLACTKCAAKLASLAIDADLLSDIRDALRGREDLEAGTELDLLERRVTTTICGERGE